MKKTLVLGIGALLLFTGCGSNKVVCTQTTEEDGKKMELQVTANMKDNKVSTVDATIKFEDDTTASQYCGLMQLFNSFTEDESKKIDVKCSGKNITIKNYDSVLASSDSENKVTGLTKDEFIQKMTSEDKNVKCK